MTRRKRNGKGARSEPRLTKSAVHAPPTPRASSHRKGSQNTPHRLPHSATEIEASLGVWTKRQFENRIALINLPFMPRKIDP
jgi:hypothetical protein